MADKTLADIPLGKVAQAQQAALMRLQLYMVMQTHAMLRGLVGDIRGELEAAGLGAARTDGGANGVVAWDGLAANQALAGIGRAWRQRFGMWQHLFEGLRWEAGAIPFGAAARWHDAMFEGARSPVHEATTIPGSPVFEPILKQILDAARLRVWGDGFNLSQRIWRLDQESLEGIRRIVYEGVADGSSAWQIAQRVSPYLGAGSDCPRWARSRLYRLTKSDIASGDRTGLYSGDECDGQGVAYNALRLARNEIQIAHHRATDEIMSRLPWVEKEQVHLSPAHPETDVCDDIISNGEKGEGIYPKGEIQLPLHPQCLCYKSSVLDSPEAFADRLRGWMRGGESWPEMDQYAGWLGTGREGISGIMVGQVIARRLLVWLWGDQAAMDSAAAEYLLAGEQLAFGFP